jgi:NDP-sugar pyrophosphorylase family protein
MSGTMQILMPMAGPSPFFDPKEHYFPKPLIEVGGSPIVEHAVSPLRAAFPESRFVFVARREDCARFSLDATLRLLAGEAATTIQTTAPTQGALCSCLLAIDALDLAAPLLISNADQVLEADLARTIALLARPEARAGVVTFRSVHPRWSYVRVDEEGFVVQAAEKSVVSDRAVAGLYYFRTAQDFVDAAFATIAADDQVDGLFYVAHCLNQIILGNGKVSQTGVPAEAYRSFYSPTKIQEYLDSRLQAAVRHAPAPPAENLNLVIPAAGEGSRFARAGWRRPKPFISVDGQPMIERVIENVRPAGSRAVVMVRAAHLEGQSDILSRLRRRGATLLPVDRLTEGTICTVMLGRGEFAAEGPVLVANSDQLVDFSVDDFIADAERRALDGSILVFRDAARDPKWSFARLGPDGLVAEVREKVAISDLATVGIYYFRRARDLVDATIDMMVRNDRVNNEFYTCPVYNYLIANGARVGVFEVEAAAMHGLGTPEDLAAYLAARDLPDSADRPLS